MVLLYVDTPSILSSYIWIRCPFSDYNPHLSSVLYIHPLQFSGFAITVFFEQCTRVPVCDYCQSLGQNGSCPSTYMESIFQCAQGREGVLCGMCNDSEGYAIAINDPDLSCIKCKSSYYGIAIFLFLQLLPVQILLMLLAFLHINITDGGLSGFVLYSQMVSLQFPGLGYLSSMPTIYCDSSNSNMDIYRDYYLSIPLTVYNIWNLNFLNLDPASFLYPSHRHSS